MQQKLVLAHLCIHPNPIYHCVGENGKNQKHKQINTYFLYNILQSNGMFTKNIIDDVQLIQGTVFDVAKDNKVKVTFVCPIQKKGNKVQVLKELQMR